MKSINCLLLTSMQLALQVDAASAFPVVKAFIGSEHQTALMSRAMPMMKREDDVRWQKRGGSGQSVEIQLERPKKEALHSNVGAESQSASVKASEGDASSSGTASISKTGKKPISRAKYHATGLGIEAKKAGQELLHGVGRGVVEMPISGAIGACNHLGVALRYAAYCQLGKAGGHVINAAGKIIVGGAVMPIWGLGSSIVHAAVPSIRTTGHFVGMVKNGAKQGYKKVRGRQIDKNIQRQDLLDNARRRPIATKPEMKEVGELLRSSYWDGTDPATGASLQGTRSFHFPRVVGGKGLSGGGGGRESSSGERGCFLFGCAR